MSIYEVIEAFRDHTDEYKEYDHIIKGYVIDGNTPSTFCFLLLTTNQREQDCSFTQHTQDIMDSVEDITEIDSIILYDDEAEIDRVAREHGGVEIGYLQEGN